MCSIQCKLATMPRVPYVYPAPGNVEADQIRLRRPKGHLIQLDGVLLNAPSIALGYSQFLGAIRNANSLPADLRELLILRVAALNSAAYEWIQHAPIGEAAGLTAAQFSAIRDVSGALSDAVDPNAALTAVQRASLIYTDWMTRNVQVPQVVFDALREHLNDQQIVEVTATVGAYNCVSRLLCALNVADLADATVPEVVMLQDVVAKIEDVALKTEETT